MSAQTIPQLFLHAVDTYDKRDAFRYHDRDGWVDVSHGMVYDRVYAAAVALQALGLARGDRIAILSENRLEWAVTDLAILSAGLVTVPVYDTLPADQAEHILRDSEARAVFVSGADQLAKLEECRGRLPMLLHVFSFDAVADREDIVPFDALVARTDMVEDRPSYRDLIATIDRSDTASIIYTSGTTAQPKGVVLTHWNFASNVHACLEAFEIGPGDRVLSFLPLSHAFERTAGFYVMMHAGATICYARSTDTVGEDMGDVSPTIVCSVPRVYEKMYERIMKKVKSSSSLRQRLFHWAVDAGRRHLNARMRGEAGAGIRWKYAVADALVFRKLRARTGGRLRFFISGGAALARDLAEFFHAAGIPILEGYGLTETSPVTTVNTLEHLKFGTVGRPIPGVEVSVADDGELLVRGDNVMKGYYKMPDATAEVIKDGWFHTGDIGHIDDDGYVVITDRKKDIIVTANGKNIAPQTVESRLESSDYIAESVLVGNKRKFVSVVIVPDFGKLEEFAEAQGMPWSSHEELIEGDAVRELFEKEIESSCSTLAPFEIPKKFILLPREFSLERGELTPSMKVKRRVVEDHLEPAIDALYTE